MTQEAQHLLANRPRTRTHDSIVALDMFSGCGGSSEGITAAGIDVWYAANHWEYAVRVHERNHPGAEHFIADLVDETARDYYHPEQLPAADVLWASPSCTNHSKANSKRAYHKNLAPHEVDDEDFDADATASEKSRATAVSVLQYARKHHPMVIAVENTVEFCQWGQQVPGKRKGDGSTFRWWLGELRKLGYKHSVLFLNSMFFGVPQSRDRVYIALWDASLRTPNLDFTPKAWCQGCDVEVEAWQQFKKQTAAWPMPNWGKYQDQYIYICPSCGDEVKPHHTPAAHAIDWSDLGARIGDRAKPMAPNTMARIARGVEKFFNGGDMSFVMPALGAGRGPGPRTTDQPLPTATTRQELLHIRAFQTVLAGNTFEHPGSSCRTRAIGAPLPTQHTTAADGFVAHPAFIDNYVGAARAISEALATQVTLETNGLVVAPALHVQRGTLNGDGSLREARLQSLTESLPAFAAGGNHQFLLSAIFAKQNGGPADTAWHQVATDPLQTATSVDSTCLVTPDQLGPVDVDDCYYRMLKPGEIQTGMGIRPDFEMWGSARDRVRALGNAVTPPVATEIMLRLTEVLR